MNSFQKKRLPHIFHGLFGGMNVSSLKIHGKVLFFPNSAGRQQTQTHNGTPHAAIGPVKADALLCALAFS